MATNTAKTCFFATTRRCSTSSTRRRALQPNSRSNARITKSRMASLNLALLTRTRDAVNADREFRRLGRAMHASASKSATRRSSSSSLRSSAPAVAAIDVDALRDADFYLELSPAAWQRISTVAAPGLRPTLVSLDVDTPDGIVKGTRSAQDIEIRALPPDAAVVPRHRRATGGLKAIAGLRVPLRRMWRTHIPLVRDRGSSDDDRLQHCGTTPDADAHRVAHVGAPFEREQSRPPRSEIRPDGRSGDEQHARKRIRIASCDDSSRFRRTPIDHARQCRRCRRDGVRRCSGNTANSDVELAHDAVIALCNGCLGSRGEADESARTAMTASISAAAYDALRSAPETTVEHLDVRATMRDLRLHDRGRAARSSTGPIPTA